MRSNECENVLKQDTLADTAHRVACVLSYLSLHTPLAGVEMGDNENFGGALILQLCCDALLAHEE